MPTPPPSSRRWPRRLVALLMLGAAVGAALGYLASTLITAGYDASAYLLVTPSAQSGVQTSEVQYAQAISQVVNNPSVLAAAGEDADLPEDPDAVRADASPNAPLIQLTVNAGDARTAQRAAQAAAEAVVAYTAEREDLLGFRAVVLAPAGRGEPAGLSLPAYLVAGAVMGAVLGGVVAMLTGERGSEPAQAATTYAAEVAGPPPTTTAR